MKNIHLIPTEKASILIQKRITKELKLSSLNNPQRWSNVNIYITSEEDIKEGDWFLSKEGIVHNNFGWNFGDKKIILTTDPDLINDGVQAIDDEFLKYLVENPSCEWVGIEEVYFHGSDYYKASQLSEQEREKHKFMREYKIIIPQEEPKQETLEEAAKTYLNSGKVPNDYQSFIAGAKWQAERRYSEEEVIKSFDNLGFKQITSEELNSLPYQPFITDEDSNIWVIDKEQWFEQFKNK
jgi:hypothetical protein